METLSTVSSPDDGSCTTKSNSTLPLPPPPPSTATTMTPPAKAELRILYRLGSGTTSVVIYANASGSEVVDSRTNILMTNINFNNNNRNKLPSSKYKGVVPQPNGRWGAQIYEKHQRVWLGTFDNEAEAARVYDVAVHRFRGGDGYINSNPLSDPVELQFLASQSKAELVDMLRKHTYYDELLDSVRLFGVDICQLPEAGNVWNSNGKRLRDAVW